MLRAGKRNRRVTLSRPTVTKDGFNADVETFDEVATIWAEYEPLSDAEQRRAAEVGATQTARFRILVSSRVADVDPTWRLAFGGADYGILGVKPCGDLNEGLEISAVARAEKVS